LSEEERYSVSSFAIGKRFLQRNTLPENICNAVGAQLGAEPGSLQPLDQVTLLARHASPIVLTAAAAGTLNEVDAQLSQLANAVGLSALNGQTLFEICVQAGALAEHTIKDARQ
jgi:hypothetical protein